MTTYFVDSSGIVKRYAEEIGTRWIQALCDVQSNHTIAIAQIGVVEVAAALARKRRDTQFLRTNMKGR
jgi:predicted nucleic acid-binding protein